MRLMPRDPPSGLVRVTTMTRSHIWPLEMKVFWDIFVTLANRARTNALQIAAGPGLGHGNRARGLARDHARQPRLLLFLGAVTQKIAAADVVGDREVGCGTRETRIGEFFDDDGVVAEVAADAAILLGHLGA